jgi:hypothetical protein
MKAEELVAYQELEAKITGAADQAGIAPQDRLRLGQMLAQIELEEIIVKTQRWARAGRLDRGLSLSLPYFDERTMEICWRELEVIPRGRIPFIPGFVVIAARDESQRVRSEGTLSAATRDHLLAQLQALELAFAGAGPRPTERAGVKD